MIRDQRRDEAYFSELLSDVDEALAATQQALNDGEFTSLSEQVDVAQQLYQLAIMRAVSHYSYGSDAATLKRCVLSIYVRTELREMLRRGNTSYSTSGTDNNWAFSSIPSSDQDDFGGIDGVLSATLAINHVTTTSANNEQVGRIVIGQIHAESNEPIRLYYHKLPGNSNGAIYFAHETSKSDGGSEKWYNLLGSMVNSSGDLSSTSNPSAGIALNEDFSYQITVDGDDLTVTISQNGTQLAKQTVDMSGSGYDDEDNYMYFKAGIYLQDNSSDNDDNAKVTFYKLSNSHDNYDY